MLSDHELMRVQEITARLERPVTLRVHVQPTELPFQQNLVNVARQIAGVSMNTVLLEESEEPVFPGRPSLTLVSAGGHGNIHYLAAPHGNELEPFLSTLAWLGEAEPLPGAETTQEAPSDGEHTEILTLIAADCPHCPEMVRRVSLLALKQPSLTLTIADAIHYSDLAERYSVRSTPTIIVDGAATLVGKVTEDEIIEVVSASRDPESLSIVLRTMIDSGRAEDAARVMLRRGRPDALLPLYKSPEFSVRMGALVTLEAALEEDPRCLDPILDELMGLLDSDDTALRGDTAELLGKIGNPRAAQALAKAAEDQDADVREAAQEALELLQSPPR